LFDPIWNFIFFSGRHSKFVIMFPTGFYQFLVSPQEASLFFIFQFTKVPLTIKLLFLFWFQLLSHHYLMKMR